MSIELTYKHACTCMCSVEPSTVATGNCLSPNPKDIKYYWILWWFDIIKAYACIPSSYKFICATVMSSLEILLYLRIIRYLALKIFLSLLL